MREACILSLPLMQFSSDWGTFWRSKATATIFFISATIKQFLLLFSFEWEQTYYWFIIFFSLNIWTVNCHWLHSSSSAGAMYYYYYYYFVRLNFSLHNTSNKKSYFSLSEREANLWGIVRFSFKAVELSMSVVSFSLGKMSIMSNLTRTCQTYHLALQIGL